MVTIAATILIRLGFWQVTRFPSRSVLCIVAAEVVSRTEVVSIRLASIDVVEKLAETVRDAPNNEAEGAVASMVLEGLATLRARSDVDIVDDRAGVVLQLLKVLADDWFPLAGRLGRLGRALRDVYDAFHDAARRNGRTTRPQLLRDVIAEGQRGRPRSEAE